MRRLLRAATATAAVIAVAALAGAAYAMNFTGWGQAQLVAGVNTTFGDGCPIESPDGLSLYMASNRSPGGEGGLDIWVAQRESEDAAWGVPGNVGPPINSAVDDFCPTPVPGNGLFFVSRRGGKPAGCGTGTDSDIYFSRRNPKHGWSAPRHLGCGANGPNTTGDEQGPSYFEADGQGYLYYSAGPDIYVSEELADGTFAPGLPVAELNSGATDIQPNVRKDGLEIVFASNRAGTQDVYTASRSDADDTWSAPSSLGTNVNTTAAAETRPSFSRDGSRLYFGRNPGPAPFGSNDIFVSTREKVTGSDD